jgi:ADP-ribosyl-[dinitrogen reductase] hydrolase
LTPPPTIDQRFRGCLLGLAIGDAIGSQVEFLPPGSFLEVTDMVGGGPFHLLAGQYSDDTSQALCLAESLIECRGFEPKNVMEKLSRWMSHGHLSSTGHCFDIGETSRRAIRRFQATGIPYAGDYEGESNGSLMRLAPVPLAFWRSPPNAIRYCSVSSFLTHGGHEARDACSYFGGLLIGCLQGHDKNKLVDEVNQMFFPDGMYPWELASESKKLSMIFNRPWDQRGIVAGLHAAECLEAALWCFRSTQTYKDAVLSAANLGNGSGSVACVVGSLAGAYHGEESIPHVWRRRLAKSNLIASMAGDLLALSEEMPRYVD